MIVFAVHPGHNAAVCILRDGEVLLNQELERYSCVKHDFGYREDFVRHCLCRVGVRPEDVDLVALNNWNRQLPWETPRTAGVEHVECGVDFFGRRVPAIAVNHHVAHVASAFYTSPFEEAAVCTIDGGGDGDNGALARCAGHRIEAYFPVKMPNVAGWWSGLTMNNYRMPRLHEWDPGSGAGKIMALAAYGDFDEAVARRFEDDVRREVYSDAYTDPPGLAFNDDEDLSDTRCSRSQALAWALQHYTERVVEQVFDDAHRHFPSDNLCYAGGIALNCVANSAALARSRFSRLHVPPCPNDTGLALGMALYAWYQHLGNPRVPGHFSPYTGPAYTDVEVEVAVRSLAATGCDIRRAGVSEVAREIELGHVVAVWRGRSECGPRALGHRSLLVRPDAPGIQDRMNFEVKRREWYRPYAPIVLDEQLGDVFETPTWSPYMTASATIRPSWRERMAGVCHVDGSTRPQTVRREHDVWTHALVSEVHRLTGVPAVLNTSFNRQAPMVETPSEAADLFLELPVSRLVLDDWLVAKARP